MMKTLLAAAYRHKNIAQNHKLYVHFTETPQDSKKKKYIKTRR